MNSPSKNPRIEETDIGAGPKSAPLDKNPWRICALQPLLTPGDFSANLDILRRMLSQAVQKQSLDLAVFPENIILRSSQFGQNLDTDSLLNSLSQLAKEFSVNLVAGSFHHSETTSGKLFNTCYVFNRTGGIAGSYSKRKLFDRELKFGVNPGVDEGVFEIEGWSIGVQICADLWFPELTRRIASAIDILAVPVQSVVRSEAYQRYGRDLWYALALTRAQENAIITVISDHPATTRKPCSSGASSICDPSLSIETADIERIQMKMGGGRTGMIDCIIDNERLKSFRKYRQERGLLPNFFN
jgi:predicted amidohydrolase